MLEEFKDLYDIHPWLRYMTWTGLLSAAMFLFWVSGGFPPQAWLLLIEVIPQVPLLWNTNGSAMLQLLIVLVSLSLIWVMGWWALFWVILVLVRHHRRMSQFKMKYDAIQWNISNELSLAVSTPIGHLAMGDVLNTSMPRIRLPQKQLQARPISQASTIPAEHDEIQDLPTQPVKIVNPIAKVSRPLTPQSLEVGVGWDAGLMRKDDPNEDSLVVLQGICTYQGQLAPFGLFVVADGMGGHDNGQEASRIAIQSMMHTVLQNIAMGNALTDDYLVNMLKSSVEWANLAIYQRSKEWGKDMGTTLTAALVVGTKAYVVNVGDSRTYLYREGAGLSQVTRDHSLVATLVAFGEITSEQIYTHPERNKVYRSLGNSETVEVDWFIVDLHSNDYLLLCSDGLWEMVRDPEMSRLMESGYETVQMGEMLVQAALHSGGVDNVSIIVVRVP